METNVNYIETIIKRTACKKHLVLTHVPCYSINAGHSRASLWGVCNDRAKKAGFVGLVKPSSMRKK